jgi:elongation factor 1-alpha
MDHIDIP